MSLELYLQETAFLAKKQQLILAEVCSRLDAGQQLTPLEESGVLHTLQVLIENAIGKAKHILKQANEPVPTSAYDAMEALVRLGILPAEDLRQWMAIIGLRNRIVHEYMNLDMTKVLSLVQQQAYQIVLDFLLVARD